MNEEQTLTGEEPQVRVSATDGSDRLEWVELTGCDTPELVEETIREAVGTDEWEIIQTDNLPIGIGEDSGSLADYVVASEEADLNGIPACVYLAVCEDHSMTVSPDSIHYYGEGRDDSDIALAVFDSFGSIEEMLGSRIESYIDWDKLGRDLRVDGFDVVEGSIIRVD